MNNDPQPGSLIRVDPATLAFRRYSLEPLREKRPPCCIHGLAADFGAVWMTFGDSAQLVRMDLDRGAFTELSTYGGGGDLVAGEGAVWREGRTKSRASAEVEGTLRIDPATNSVVGIGPVAAGVTAGNGEVWVVEASSYGNDRRLKMERLDPSTGQPIGQPITLEAGPPKVNFEGVPFDWRVRIAYGDGALWVTVGDSFEAIRISPV